MSRVERTVLGLKKWSARNFVALERLVRKLSNLNLTISKGTTGLALIILAAVIYPITVTGSKRCNQVYLELSLVIKHFDPIYQT